MKLQYLIGLVFGLQLSVTSCDDMAFLQIKPDNLILTDDAVKTTNDLEKILLGAYDQIRTSGFLEGNSLRGFDVIADDGIANTATFEWVQMATHEMNLVNQQGRNMWNNTYTAINRANQTAYNELADAILASAGEQTANQFKAEAAFIRALGHFHLVRAFGLPYSEETKDVPQMGIPIRTKGVMDRETSFEIVQRSTVAEVYSQIISDLKFAVEYLPTDNTWNSGRTTTDAAKALLAKVYFYQKDYANAAILSRQVIDSRKYKLDEDMTAKYARAEKGTSTQEVLFMIPAKSITEDSWGGLRSYRTNGLSLPTNHPSEELIKAYDQKNDRRFTSFYTSINNLWYTTKFDYEYMDGIVLGYNELLLIFAESVAESGGDLAMAVSALNEIERRAYGEAKTTALEKGGIISAVQKERRLELALLGERLFELKRLKKSIRGDAWDSHKLLFQIPDTEQSGNPDVNMN